MSRRLATLLVLPALLAGACVTTSTTSRTMYADGSPGDAGWERPGKVEWVRETVTRTDGNPAGGALAGALIGGLIGGSMFGHTHYDAWGHGYWHGSGPGALFGAATGAAVGAAASSPSGEDRTYDVMVRFNDGGSQVYRYRGAPPFRPGEEVVLTGRGLQRLGS